MPTIRLWNSETGEAVTTITDWGGDLQVGWDQVGPAAASMSVPYGTVTRSLLEPGGAPVLCEVDARAEGVPEVWLGIFTGIDAASGQGPRGLSFEGPAAWLDADSAVVGARENVTMSPGELVRRVISQHPLDLRLDVADIYPGPGLPIELSGQSVWGLMTDLATRTAEEPRLVAIPGRARLALSWLSPFAPLDLAPVMTLTEKVCTWSYTGSVQTRTELAIVGASWDVGARARGVRVQSETGRVLGRRAALAAVVSEAAGLALDEGSGAQVDVQTSATAMLRATIMTQLHRWITPRYPIVIRIPRDADPGRNLWQYCRIGALLRVNFDDDYGPFGDAVVRVQTAAFQLGGSAVAELGCELWEAL